MGHSTKWYLHSEYRTFLVLGHYFHLKGWSSFHGQIRLHSSHSTTMIWPFNKCLDQAYFSLTFLLVIDVRLLVDGSRFGIWWSWWSQAGRIQDRGLSLAYVILFLKGLELWGRWLKSTILWILHWLLAYYTVQVQELTTHTAWIFFTDFVFKLWYSVLWWWLLCLDWAGDIVRPRSWVVGCWSGTL